ncbi:hypothetical protein BBK36DRAFT_1143417 [Trichoderma citrinoviride]|uniref:Uncharacterized protein n=1 Tax=Trichoderma citrinoviride TaxID=58853 RepID=A0A2T4B2Z6_9HYPO|nr:hypothetical protein BBK36DRAFT_1143417 [Trichoderma citrinoviride]PTB63702.1 hypothetical protein BBK36DRAFT_1143417 [Trichoderma citrinoviride]
MPTIAATNLTLASAAPAAPAAPPAAPPAPPFPPAPPAPRKWKWQCHRCGRFWPLSSGRRCLSTRCGHERCTRLEAKLKVRSCGTQFDTAGWRAHARWREQVDEQRAARGENVFPGPPQGDPNAEDLAEIIASSPRWAAKMIGGTYSCDHDCARVGDCHSKADEVRIFLARVQGNNFVTDRRLTKLFASYARKPLPENPPRIRKSFSLMEKQIIGYHEHKPSRLNPAWKPADYHL